MHEACRSISLSSRFKLELAHRDRSLRNIPYQMAWDPKSLVSLVSSPSHDPEDDVDKERASGSKEGSETKTAKWKRTLYLGSATSVIVLLINLVMVLWARLRQSEYGRSVLLLSEDCDRIKRLSTGVHLLINILSTLLLSASNFAMVWPCYNSNGSLLC